MTMKYYVTKYQSNIREKPLGVILGLAEPNTFVYSVCEPVEYEGINWILGFVYGSNGIWYEGYVAISKGENIYLDEFNPHLFVPLPFKANTYVTQLFGERPQTYAQFGYKGHNGVDLVGTDKNVYAVGFGQAYVGFDKNGYGNYVKITGPTLTTVYAHLSQVLITNGSINQGQLIGVEGSTGNSTGSHLHIDIRLNSCDIYNGFGGRIDPLVYFNTWDKLIFPDYVKGMNNYDKSN